LPATGLVLEIASGTGEHSVHFGERFPNLEWQPSDIDPGAFQSIRAWRRTARLPNVREPIEIDASRPPWPIERADAVVSINMVHISPWSAALGLLDGAAKVLQPAGPLILYGPWLKADVSTAPSNLAFDQQLRERDPEWGLRKVEDFEPEAVKRGFQLERITQMPANNLMLLFRLKR
jgi:SAM-dependent methyltransferase